MRKIIVIVSLFICVLFLGGCIFEYSSEGCKNYYNLTEQTKAIEEKALVYEQMTSWGGNTYNPNEVLFDVAIANFGYVEAKNLEVKCYIENSKDARMFETTEKIGNVGSTSIIYKQIVLEGKAQVDSKGFCYVSKCDNCTLLNERIVENQEYRN